MASNFFSVTTAWEGLDNYYNGLNLDCSDVLFGTDIPGTKNYVPGGINYCSIAQTLKLVDQEEQEVDKVRDYAKLYNSNVELLNKETEPYLPTAFDGQTERSTVYHVLRQHPRCSKFKQIADESGFIPYLYQSQNCSMFIPVNEAIPDVQPWLELPSVMLRNLLKAHTMNYSLDPSSLVNRKLQVLTCLRSFTPIVDGLNPNHILIYENDYTLNDGYYYAPLIKRSSILEQIVTTSGTAYLIDTVLQPNVIIN